ncbi:MAG: hypothetical protein AAF757_01670 [Cyanobacteria bacterium P01_D01_bin.116]|mgnify:CR=1
MMYLNAILDIALLSREEHNSVNVSPGNWMVQIQREYEPEGWL